MRSVPRVATATALILIAGAMGVTSTGCTKDNGPVITREETTVVDTSTITPLEKGRLRREILDVVRGGIDAWVDNDASGMEKVFNADAMKLFEKTWDGYAARDLAVKHVHEELWFDVTELNKSGTQAIVQYRYNDTSYLVDKNGNKVEDLKPLKDNEPQFTLEKQDDESWKIIRMIASADTYR